MITRRGTIERAHNVRPYGCVTRHAAGAEGSSSRHNIHPTMNKFTKNPHKTFDNRGWVCYNAPKEFLIERMFYL